MIIEKFNKSNYELLEMLNNVGVGVEQRLAMLNNCAEGTINIVSVDLLNHIYRRELFNAYELNNILQEKI